MEHELGGIGKPGISDTGWYQSGSNGITCYLLNFDICGLRFYAKSRYWNIVLILKKQKYNSVLGGLENVNEQAKY